MRLSGSSRKGESQILPFNLEQEENVEAFCSVFWEKFADMFYGLGGRCHDKIKREKKNERGVKGKLLFGAPRQDRKV